MVALIIGGLLMVALGIALWAKYFPEQAVEEEQVKVCDTCGQIDSQLKEGQCSWCQKFYKAHQ